MQINAGLRSCRFVEVVVRASGSIEASCDQLAPDLVLGLHSEV